MGQKRVVNNESKVIRHYLDIAVHQGLIGRMEYASRVAEHFMDTVPTEERRTTKASGRGKMVLDFHVVLPSDSGDVAYDKRKANAKKILTYLNKENHMVLDMRRSFEFCMPMPLRLEIKREILRDEGYFCVAMMSPGHQDAGALHIEYGDVARADGALRANDGQINERDDPAALRVYVKEMDDLIEVALANKALAEAALDKQAG